MTIKLKSVGMEVYCDEVVFCKDGSVRVNKFIDVERRNIGRCLHIPRSTQFKLTNVDETFQSIEKEAWENIKAEHNPIEFGGEVNIKNSIIRDLTQVQLHNFLKDLREVMIDHNIGYIASDFMGLDDNDKLCINATEIRSKNEIKQIKYILGTNTFI